MGGREIEEEEVGESGRMTVRERGEGEDPIGLWTTHSRSSIFPAWSVFVKITDAVASPPISEVVIQSESSMRPMVSKQC